MPTRSIPLIVALLALAAGGSASAALRAVEAAYELGLRGMVLPAGATGQMTLRRCTSCKAETLQVTAETRFFVRPAAAPVPLEALRAAAARALMRGTPFVYVYYEPRSRIARRVVLDPGP